MPNAKLSGGGEIGGGEIGGGEIGGGEIGVHLRLWLRVPNTWCRMPS